MNMRSICCLSVFSGILWGCATAPDEEAVVPQETGYVSAEVTYVDVQGAVIDPGTGATNICPEVKGRLEIRNDVPRLMVIDIPGDFNAAPEEIHWILPDGHSVQEATEEK